MFHIPECSVAGCVLPLIISRSTQVDEHTKLTSYALKLQKYDLEIITAGDTALRMRTPGETLRLEESTQRCEQQQAGAGHTPVRRI